jgi:hypothetical protein
MPESDPLNTNLPTPDTLGGIYVRVEEKEDLTVLPGQIPVVLLPTTRESNGAGMPAQDPCLNICIEGEEGNPSAKAEAEGKENP